MLNVDKSSNSYVVLNPTTGHMEEHVSSRDESLNMLTNMDTQRLLEQKHYTEVLSKAYRKTTMEYDPIALVTQNLSFNSANDLDTIVDANEKRSTTSSYKNEREATTQEVKDEPTYDLGAPVQDKLVNPYSARGTTFYSKAENEEEANRYNNLIDSTFGKNNEISKILKECIPCGLRKFDDLTFSTRNILLLNDITKRFRELWEKMCKLFQDLTTESLDDLCNLLNLMKYQCVPDLSALIALLTMMQLKYLNEIELSIDGLMSTLLGALLGPILSNISLTLDKYIDVIVNPIICVLAALESQMAKLDVASAMSARDRMIQSDYNRKKEFYDKKIAALNARKLKLANDKKNGFNYPTYDLPTISGEGGLTDTLRKRVDASVAKANRRKETGKVFDDNVVKENKIKTKAQELPFPNVDSIKNSIVSPYDGADEYDNDEDVGTEEQAIDTYDRRTIDVEMDNIDKAIARAQEMKKNYEKDPFSDAANAIANSSAAKAVNSARVGLAQGVEQMKANRQMLKDITNSLIATANDGINMINATLDAYKEEMLRTIFGRAESQEDQIDMAMKLQSIMRYIAITKALINLFKNGKKICQNQSSSDALGSFMQEYANGNPGQTPRFTAYAARDADGNELAIFTPPQTKLTASGLVSGEEQENLLKIDAFIEEDSIRKVNIYNELGEAEEANKKGILTDIGSVDGMELSTETNNGLNKKDNYVIMINNFCSDTNQKASFNKLKDWASNL